MKTKILIFLSIFIITTNLCAQEPVFEWAETFEIIINSLAVDEAGNSYYTGYYENTVDFDPGSGVFNLVSNGQEDIFILKLDVFGNFEWAINYGGIGGDEGVSLVVDSVGNIYIAGEFGETLDFDPGPGVCYLVPDYYYAEFILKLDTYGNFIWAKMIDSYLGVWGNNSNITSLKIDNNTNVYITGTLQGTVDFDPGPAIYNLTADGWSNIFLSKLNSSGEFVWAKKLDGSEESMCNSLTIGGENNIYAIGYFSDTTDFDPGPGVYNLVSEVYADIFIAKYDSLGNFVWAKRIGDIYGENAFSLAADDNENIYYTGFFKGTVDFDPGPGVYNLVSNGSEYIFISKLSSSGNFIWAKSMGSNYQDIGYSLALDSAYNVYTTGEFDETVDFDPGPGVYNLSSNGNDDIFISKLDSLGNFVWARNIGGNMGDVGRNIVLDKTANIYSSGGFDGTVDFDPGPGIYNLTEMNNAQNYFLKITQSFTALHTNLDISCFGNSDASINISVYNGVSPYSFLWSNGETTEDISNLGAGTYYVSITDANNDLITDSVIITQPDEFDLSFVATDASAIGASDGTIDLSVNGATPPYSYLWNTGDTIQDLSNLPIGQYSVTITDANLCYTIDTINIFEPYYNRLPLLEHFSSGSSACYDCCNLEQNFQNIISQTNGQCAVIRYPGNIFPDGYETTESNARYNFYGVNTIPTVVFNGGTPQSSSIIDTNLIVNSYDNDTTPVNIISWYNFNGTQVDIQVEINTCDIINLQNIVLQLAIVENKTANNVSCTQIDSTLFVLKKMLPDENGTDISQMTIANTNYYYFSYTFPAINTVENFDNLAVVAFVQDNISQHIYQSARVEQTPELIAFLGADTTFGHLPLDIQFADLSSGLPTSWFWDFGDGTTSTLQNPVHTYQTGGLYTVSLIVSNFFGSDTVEFIEYIEVANAQSPGWSYNITGYSHTILIPNTTQIKINGVQIDTGDYFGVFYDSLGTLACGGYQIWDGTTTSVTAWGEDLGNDGFAGSEEFKWKIWDASTNIEYNAMATYIPFPQMPYLGFFVSLGTSGLTSLVNYDIQQIDLPLGWSIFSTYISPFDADIQAIFASIISDILIIKSGSGSVFWPAFSINQIGNIATGEGYQVKTNFASTFMISGNILNPIYTPISINSGWSLIGYIRTSPATIDTMLSSIVNEIVLVKNGYGFVYWPAYGINNIGNMIPGEGYQVKMTNAVSLTYPPN
ncbi:MAG: PKD domain-containing protein [Bacteroidetes bacterium]|nr:PKD domain-containing protein [Bacteroidota bacterium]